MSDPIPVEQSGTDDFADQKELDIDEVEPEPFVDVQQAARFLSFRPRHLLELATPSGSKRPKSVES